MSIRRPFFFGCEVLPMSLHAHGPVGVRSREIADRLIQPPAPGWLSHRLEPQHWGRDSDDNNVTRPFSLSYERKMVERLSGTDAASARQLARLCVRPAACVRRSAVRPPRSVRPPLGCAPPLRSLPARRDRRAGGMRRAARPGRSTRRTRCRPAGADTGPHSSIRWPAS